MFILLSPYVRKSLSKSCSEAPKIGRLECPKTRSASPFFIYSTLSLLLVVTTLNFWYLDIPTASAERLKMIRLTLWMLLQMTLLCYGV